VADHDRLPVELRDHLCIVIGDLADGLVREDLGARVRLLDGLRVVGPAGRERRIARGLEELGPAIPAARQQPEAVDEDDGDLAGRVAARDLVRRERRRAHSVLLDR
jgi:hypothetical protein